MYLYSYVCPYSVYATSSYPVHFLPPSLPQEVFENWPILVLAVWDTGDNVTVRPYQLDQASELTPMGGVAPADPTVGRYLAQHTVLLRVSASLPLYIISNNSESQLCEYRICLTYSVCICMFVCLYNVCLYVCSYNMFVCLFVYVCLYV